MKSATIASSDFNKIITCTRGFLASPKGARPIHSFIRLEFSAADQRMTAVAVDGYRLSVEHSVVSNLDEDFVAYIKPNFSLPKDQFAEISLEEDGAICQISCNGILFGYEQPKGDFLEYQKVIPCQQPTLRIGFNGNYLLEALKAAKASAGGFKNVVELEFTNALSPVLFRTGKDDVKMVLPVRCSGEWRPLPFAAGGLPPLEEKKKGHWIYWEGYKGNTGMRIDDAVCSCCGYRHPAVARYQKGCENVLDTADLLAHVCPGCGAEMEKNNGSD